MAKRPDRPKRVVKKRARPSPRRVTGEAPNNDERTTWIPSGIDPGDDSWASADDLPDFERTEAKGPRIPQPRPPKKRLPTPEPAPRRQRSIKQLPTPEPAPRRKSRKKTEGKSRLRTVTASRKPPTPEPAPPRRSLRTSSRADEEVSLTIPRPPGARIATSPPPPERIGRPDVPPTPAIDTVATELALPKFPSDPSASFDEVPPAVALQELPNDAPTVVRPDLAGLAELEAPVPSPTTSGGPFPSTFGTTDGPSCEEETQPPGEPTVALPSTRNAPSLPDTASYSPPVDAKTVVRPQTEHADTKKPKKTKKSKKPKKSKRQPSLPPTSKKSKERPKLKKVSSNGASKKKRDKPKSKGIPSSAQIAKPGESFEEDSAIRPIHYIYAAVAVGGIVLIAAAIFAGMMILAIV